MAAVPSITVRTPDGVLTFTPDSTTPLAQLYTQTGTESHVIQEAIDAYLQVLIAELATEVDFVLENAAIMLRFSLKSRVISHALRKMLMQRKGLNPDFTKEILAIDSPIEQIEELTRQLQALGPVPKPVPVPPPGKFMPTIGHELEEE
ncbi:MAG: hypothetical protein WBP22_01140 [Candidatus Saccharimonas sp.]